MACFIEGCIFLMDNIKLDNDIWFEIMPSLKQC